jgi:hypothetical protein
LVAVLARKQFGGEAHFVIRQPDSTLTLLPAWMAAPAAASFRLMADPRLPVNRLLDVRALVEALLASSLGESPRSQGGDHGQHERQRDLFEGPPTVTGIPINVQPQMLELLKELLTEALAGGPAEIDDVDKKEDGGDEDHA